MITVTGIMIPSGIKLNDQPPERMLPKMISGPPIMRVQRLAGAGTVLRTATVEGGNGLGFASMFIVPSTIISTFVLAELLVCLYPLGHFWKSQLE
jgi:hypothetical protein